MRSGNLPYRKLDAWPDVAAGLARLERKFWIAPVSNGHIALMVALARRNGFVWSAVLGAELAGSSGCVRSSRTLRWRDDFR